MACWDRQDGAQCDLESLVCVEVQCKTRVREEKVQPAEVEQIIAADLLGKGFDCAWVLYWVQQAHLHPCTHCNDHNCRL